MCVCACVRNIERKEPQTRKISEGANVYTHTDMYIYMYTLKLTHTHHQTHVHTLKYVYTNGHINTHKDGLGRETEILKKAENAIPSMSSSEVKGSGHCR